MSIPFPDELRGMLIPCDPKGACEWSFGAITAKRNQSAPAGDFAAHKGSLLDQSIFGPLHDFECACGKHVGQRYRGIVCDRCGVKVTTSASRGKRFAHINLRRGMWHPLGPASPLLALPVVPAKLFESPAGAGLPELYESIVDAVAEEDDDVSVARAFAEVVRIVLPSVLFAHRWQLTKTIHLLARGAALRPADGVQDLADNSQDDD